MKFSEMVTKEMLKKAAKKCARVAYDDIIFPAAEKYVKSTENDYDNMGLVFLNDFVNDLFEEKK